MKFNYLLLFLFLIGCNDFPPSVIDSGEEEIEYKFNEANTIEQIKRYVDSTYERHYGYGKYQATDMIIDAGYGEAFCIGNIMKYAMRYGKKPNPFTGEHRNQADLLKIIHYAIIAIHLWVEEKTKSETN